MECPRCKQNNNVKNGIIKNKQRYLCKECNYSYTVAEIGKSHALKRQAINLYLEGLSYRSIERILNVSNVSIMKWVQKLGKEIEAIRGKEVEIDIIRIDELNKFIKRKKINIDDGFMLIGLGNNTFSCVVKGRKTKQ